LELLKEAASIIFIVAAVFGLSWLLRKSGFTGT
jgi:hypothetical protein